MVKVTGDILGIFDFQYSAGIRSDMNSHSHVNFIYFSFNCLAVMG